MNLMDYEEVKRWLAGRGKGTVKQYLSIMRKYTEFTGLNPAELIDEAEEDRKKSRRERGKPEYRLKEFHEWLLNDYEWKKGKGVSKNRAKLAF
jgi:hypothetical protein